MKKPAKKTKPMRVLNIRIDEAVDAAIDKLAATLPPGMPQSQTRSTAVRRAILEAAERLDAKGGKL